MDQQGLSSRAIRGMYFAAMEEQRLPWLDLIANLFDSDQASETYKFLGMSPAMREWVGGRSAKGFNENGITIANKHYESTIEVSVKDARRDKTGQIRARVDEHTMRAQTHWASLLSTLLINAESMVCYDGQFYFDTDHVDVGAENQTSQSNDISVDISALPAAVSGTTTAPSLEEIQQAIMLGITQIASFLDDRGEPINEGAQQFLVMTPPSLYNTALHAMAPAATRALQQNLNPNIAGKFTVDVESNARLAASWTDKFAIFRTDSGIKPLIRQRETPPQLKSKAEGTDFEFDNDAWEFGLDAWRNVGYGLWQRACLVTMV